MPRPQPTLPNALDLFHPLIAKWFREKVGTPTRVQQRAWPEIAAGRHVLATAPTGSGKTLTAFLWALHQLLTGEWEPAHGTRVLYVSPLKALNNDVQRNLLAPLEALQTVFAEAGVEAPTVRVMTRSGDTSEKDRRKMRRDPPEILITTPESLNILLTSKSGRNMLGDLTTVILDEIHAVAGSKRGTHLMTAVERLTLLSGEFQRIALSATVRPMERVARFVGGWEILDWGEDGGEARYRPREIDLVDGGGGKRYDLAVAFPLETGAAGKNEDEGDLPANLWEVLTEDFKERIRKNTSTLLFANSRRTTEKVARFLNEGETTELAYAHHGSLSREIRTVVEERLKAGRLAAIVSTSSLELGIDIGALDEVILVQTPPTIAAAIQRIGRAGHGVGEVSRGRLYPTHARDFLDAAVIARSVLDGDLEEVHPPANPLDVLAQVILSMVAAEPWPMDDLYRFLRSTSPYRDLPRRWFDLVLDMLAGRYADTRLRDLKPRIAIDRVEGTVRGRRGAPRLIYMSGGTIPDRGYYNLKLQDSGAKIGELDEEFVWERHVGDVFHLGAQSWRIRQVTHNDVMVTPARKKSGLAPFWRAEELDRSFHLSQKIGRFLEEAEGALARNEDGRQGLRERLIAEHAMTEEAADRLLDVLERQRAATGALPHRRRILIERVDEGGSRSDRRQVILHTFWGGRVHRPFALALAAAWEERHPEPLEVLHDNDCIMLHLPVNFRLDVDELFALVDPHRIEELLRKNLERTGFFGARFRENAGRALLLPRAGFDRRVPLWLNRLRSKKLLEAVSEHADFPLLIETWRTCLQDEMDLESLRRVLREIDDGEIALAEVRTTEPSLFAQGLIWKQTNQFMYEDDTPEGGRAGPALGGDLLKELVYSSDLRPRIPGDLIHDFERKLQRLAPGYAPTTPEDLLEWIKERLVLPQGEWRELLEAVERDAELEPGEISTWLEALSPRAVHLRLQPEGPPLMAAVETIPRLEAVCPETPVRDTLASLPDPDAPAPEEALQALQSLPPRKPPEEDEEDLLTVFLAEWIRFYGPFPETLLTATLGLPEEPTRRALEELIEEDKVLLDRFRKVPEEREAEDAGLELVDARNLEILLRLLRSAARTRFTALPLEQMPLFWAQHQGLLGRPGGPAVDEMRDLQEVLEPLFGYPAPAGLWESDLLPARLDPYYPSWLDTLMLESDLVWVGTGSEKLTFVLGTDLDLFLPSRDGEDEASEELRASLRELFGDVPGKLSFEDLLERTGLEPRDLNDRLWELAWGAQVSNSSYAAVRKGLLSKFQLPLREVQRLRSRSSGSRRSTSRRRAFDRWQAVRPYSGDWFRLDDALPAPREDDEPLDALDLQELDKDRVRQLLDRYGVVFRELLSRELPELAWRRMFRALRLMELSGEVLTGHFFQGVPGLQFASHGAFRRLKEGLPEDAVYWMNALDPASPCGLGLEDLKGEVPPRIPSNHLVFHGSRRVVTSKRTGSELEIAVAPDHPHLADYLEFLKILLTRDAQPVQGLDVETINGEDAAQSPYARTLSEMFDATVEHRNVRLRRRY